MKSLAWTAAVLILVGAGDAAAQEAAPKYRVRTADGQRLQGYVRDRSAHELVVVTADGREHRVPVSEVARLEVRRRNGSHLWRGAVVGAFLAASLIATGAIDAIEDRGKTSGAALGLLGGATVAGGVIGGTVPRYGWSLTSPQAVAGRGIGFRVAVRF